MLYSHVMRVWVQVLWASMLRNKFKKAGITDVNVTNTAINQLPHDAQLVITQKH